MSFSKDFMRYFKEINIIHLNPLRIELNESRQARKFQLAEVMGEWVRGEGGANQDRHRNPQIQFSLSNCRDRHSTCTVVVCLSQEVAQRTNKMNQIGFSIFNSNPDQPLDQRFFPAKDEDVQGKSGAYINSRDVSGSFLLPAGDFTILPSTFHTEECGRFQLRLYVDARWRCEVGRWAGGPRGRREAVPLVSVRDYSSSLVAAQRCRSLWTALLCCSCCCLPACRGRGGQEHLELEARD
jgi:hypothetical protein